MTAASTSEAHLRLLIDHVGDALFLVDARGHVLTWNPAAELMFGHSPDQAIGMTLGALDLDDPAHAGSADRELAAAVTSERFEHAGWRRHRDGRQIWTTSTISSVHGEDGAVTGFVVIVRDKTALKRTQELLDRRTQELERSNRELEAFASVASHDLQEPLRKIRMFADRLVQKLGAGLTTEATTLADKIDDAATRMQALIEALLEYATVSRRARPDVRVDLVHVMDSVVADLEPRLLASGGRIEVGALPTIDGDPTQLRQLLQNLVANGLKFSRSGVPPVVSVTSELEPSGRWAIRVSDNGIGFEARHADRIFGLLQRLHPRFTYEGTGMGLAICRRIVEGLGGTIVAEGRPGVGATFTVKLASAQRPGEGHGA